MKINSLRLRDNGVATWDKQHKRWFVDIENTEGRIQFRAFHKESCGALIEAHGLRLLLEDVT